MNPEELTPENCRLLLAAYMEKNDVDASRIAKAIGCRHASLGRILSGKSLPSDNFLAQVGILIGIGIEKYLKLSKAEKEKITEAIGAAGAGAFGFSGIAAAIGASGTTVGLSATGISSGLAAIGTTVGGGMVAGVTMLAAVPLAAGAAGFGIIKGVKFFFSEAELNKLDVDDRWERPKG